MPPNKNNRKQLPRDTTKYLTGNEENNRQKDIFTDIEEPKTSGARNVLLVTDKNSAAPTVVPQEQQVVSVVENDDAKHVNNEAKISTDHTIVNVHPTLEPPQATQNQQQQQQQQLDPKLPSQIDHLTPNVDLSVDEEDVDDVFDEAAMSATLTRLTTPNGAEIYLVGTAHFSLQSVQDVRKVIRAIKPTSVILELCKERAFMLSFDEQYLFEQNSKLSFDTMKQAIVQKGVIQGLIYVLFIKMSSSLTEKLGMAPGAEFRAGSTEAQKISGCSVVLADRSLRTTITRAVRALNLWQKMKFVYQVMSSDFSITQEDVERCKDRDILEQLLLELGGEFPGFKRVLLDERDVYLSHSIYKWAQNCETSLGPPRVVAIMGIGHVPGIVANWGKTTDEQIRALNVIPETSRTEIVITKTVKYGTIAVVLYVAYCCLVPSSIQNSVGEKLSGRWF